MKLWQHTLAAVPLAGAVAWTTESWMSVCLVTVSCIFIDLDHLPDYVYFRKGWRGVRDFLATCNGCKLSRTFLILHAWEWLILLALCLAAGIGRSWLWPVALGVLYHLVLDTLTNPVPPSFYWLINRARSGFRFTSFYNRVKADA